MTDLTLNKLISSVFEIEANALLDNAKFTGACEEAARLIHSRSGALVVAGVGKSGHIGRKIASTFSSLMTPAIFVHAAEASHGDLGLVGNDSVVMILSNSGETSELSDLMLFCQQRNIPIIGITRDKDSTLGQASTVVVAYGRREEACIHGLAPTTSTTLSLAIGDAIAVAVSALKGIQPEDFRKFHPGGKLGHNLKKVTDLMRAGVDLPLVAPNDDMADVVVVMSEKTLGIALVSEDGRPVGIITDGDLRRHVRDLWSAKAKDIATPNPKTVNTGMRVAEATAFMAEHRIDSVVVCHDDGRISGVVSLKDCLT